MMSAPLSTTRFPRSPWELLFSVSFFLYATSMVAAALMTVRLAWRKEQNPAQKLRLWTTCFSTLTAIVFFVAKIVFFFLHYYFGGVLWINQMSLVALALTGLLLPLSLLPGAMFRWLVLNSPLRYARHLLTLHTLLRLEKRFEHLFPPLPLPRYSLISTPFNLQRATYRAVIAILDSKKLLGDYLSLDANKRTKQIGFAWSKELEGNAQELHQALSILDTHKEDDYHQLIQALVQTNRQIKLVSKNKKRRSLAFGQSQSI